MINSHSLLYCNLSFDLRFTDRDLIHYAAAFAEATLYFLFVGDPDDAIILDCEPGPEYYEYLQNHGIKCPACYNGPVFKHKFEAFPWGWNHDACNRFDSPELIVNHPPLDVVRKVNCRTFSFELARAEDIGIPGVRHFQNETDLYGSSILSLPRTLLLKPAHGNSGIGFLLKKPGPWKEKEQRRVNEILSETDQGVFLEPLLNRKFDISTRFELLPDGTIHGVAHHRTLNNRAGVFYGIHLTPRSTPVQKWLPQLEQTVPVVGAALHQAGYYGPVGFDSMVFENEKGELDFIPLLEINARHTMSTIAYALRKKLAPDQHCLFVLAPIKRYRRIETYAELGSALGQLLFDRNKAQGILLFTPLSLLKGGSRVAPHRLGFFIAAPTEQELWSMDSALRKLLQKKYRLESR